MAVVAPDPPALAHASLYPRWIAVDEGKIRHVMRDYRHRPYQCVTADSRSAQDSSICPARGPALHQGRQKLNVLIDFGSGIEDVGKDGGRANEYRIFQRHAVIDADIVLNAAAVANADIWPDVHVLAQDAVFAYHRPGANVAEVPDFGGFPAFDVCVNNLG